MAHPEKVPLTAVPKKPRSAHATGWTVLQADAALCRLIDATIDKESALLKRDMQVASVEKRHAGAIARACAEVAALEGELEQFYTAQRAQLCPPGRKSAQLAHGTLGTRTAGQAALAPLNERWTWDKIGAALRSTYDARFFQNPKPPAIDKAKLKNELSAIELRKCGMTLERGETFYIELNRLDEAA